jgi:activator of HSP90 ATPase
MTIGKTVRVAIALSAIGMICSSLALPTAGAQQNAGTTINSLAIHQEVDFKASPQQLYDALLDAKQLATFSARPAEMNRVPGGSFSLFGGQIVGRNVELVPNRRIVQAWRVTNWPEGVYSIVKFELQGQGSGTRMIFDHTGFPEDARDHLATGWETNYWTPLKKHLK